jgi:hypothetical protein
MRKKEENPMGEEAHPIPSHGITIFLKVSHGMRWDGTGLSHPIRSPVSKLLPSIDKICLNSMLILPQHLHK